MFDILKNLCTLCGASGSERPVRDYIISEIEGHCEYKIDALGNILFEKKGKRAPIKRVMLDAHTDEVGFIVTSVCENGFLRFAAVGGVEKEALLFKRVLINGSVLGVTGNKPVHLCKKEEMQTPPDAENMYIDIGAESKTQALAAVTPGDTGVICGEYVQNGSRILSKALDDRVGCAVLISLIKDTPEYGFCGSFSVCEEVGCRGAKAAAFTLSPDIAIVLEGTTAADVPGVTEERKVCALGGGAAVSFMDSGCVYDCALFKTAMESGIVCQTKSAATGGNDAAAIHLSKGGVRTAALSVPCRYIHSAGSVCDTADIESLKELAKYLTAKAAAGEC